MAFRKGLLGAVLLLGLAWVPLPARTADVDGQTWFTSPPWKVEFTNYWWYLMQAGVEYYFTVTLPDPGSLAQRIEIADVTSQATTNTITVNAGTRDIETAGQTSYTIDRNDAVLVLSYTGSKWKIL